MHESNALAVKCPRCNAEAEARCTMPSGRYAKATHQERMEAGQDDLINDLEQIAEAIEEIDEIKKDEFIKLTVPGEVYNGAIRNSQVPKEENWPEVEERKIGRGYQYVYYVDAKTQDLIVSHVETWATTTNVNSSQDPEGYERVYASREWIKKFTQDA